MPVWYNIGLSVLLVYILQISFSFTSQIFGPTVPSVWEDQNPECRFIYNAQMEYKDSSIYVSYSMKGPREIARSHSHRLFRLKINGSFCSHELRSNEAIFKSASKDLEKFTMIFPLVEEGQLKCDLLCVDKILASETFANPKGADQNYTIFHTNGTITNYCLQENEYTLYVQPRTRLINQTYSLSETKFTDSPSLLIQNGSFVEANVPDTKQIINKVLLSTWLSLKPKDKIWLNYLEPKQDITPILSKLYPNVEIQTLSNQYERVCVLTPHQNITQVPSSLENIRLLINSITNYSDPDEFVIYNHKHSTDNAPGNQGDLEYLLRNQFKEKFVIQKFFKTSLNDKIEVLQKAKAMITVDDDNEIFNAIWMRPNSTLIVLHPPKTKDSPTSQFIDTFPLRIVHIFGRKASIDDEMGESINPDSYSVDIRKILKEIP